MLEEHTYAAPYSQYCSTDNNLRCCVLCLLCFKSIFEYFKLILIFFPSSSSSDLFVLHRLPELRGWVMVTLYGKVVGVSEVARFFSWRLTVDLSLRAAPLAAAASSSLKLARTVIFTQIRNKAKGCMKEVWGQQWVLWLADQHRSDFRTTKKWLELICPASHQHDTNMSTAMRFSI